MQVLIWSDRDDIREWCPYGTPWPNKTKVPDSHDGFQVGCESGNWNILPRARWARCLQLSSPGAESIRSWRWLKLGWLMSQSFLWRSTHQCLHLSWRFIIKTPLDTYHVYRGLFNHIHTGHWNCGFLSGASRNFPFHNSTYFVNSVLELYYIIIYFYNSQWD